MSQRTEDQQSVAVEYSEADALPILRDGEVIGGHQIPWSSNYTFLVQIDAGPGQFLRAVYKPKSGERPLHDFPNGTLYRREYASFLIGRELGWPPVPLTLIREGPYGLGSMQIYIESDPRITYFDLISDHFEPLRRFAAFDLVVNNADRKGGHCVLGTDGTVWSIDHGLTFHPEFKLRTVMMEFWGACLGDTLLADIESLINRLSATNDFTAELNERLTNNEIDLLRQRAEAVLDDPRIPQLDPRLNIPWPLE